MDAHLEIWSRGAPSKVPLGGERLTAGKAPTNDVPIKDRAVSRLHAVFERLPSGWCVKDLGSRNGTFVNGERIWTERALRPGDEVQMGTTRIVFRAPDVGGDLSMTEGPEAAPSLTPRERDVLVSLCRPLLEADLFTEPASIRGIAERLVVSDAAVKQHLARLYDKFGLQGEGERRRVRLANEAIRRGAVTMADLQSP